METVKIDAPSAPLRGPAGLEGVLIDSCAFTESVGKKEPRPPLWTNHYTGNIFLVVDGGMVYVKLAPHDWPTTHPQFLGVFFTPYVKRSDVEYTGPITPAMWAIIRKWWNP